MKEIISEIHSDNRCSDVDFNDESTIRKIVDFFLSIPYRIISFLHII